MQSSQTAAHGPQGRRIGARVGVIDLVAFVRIELKARFGRVKISEVEVDVDNLSVTGAGLVGPRSAPIAVGTVIDLRLDDAWGKAWIKRTQPTDDPAKSFWGVEFVGAKGPFLDAVSRRLGDDNPVSRGIQMRD